MIFDYSDKEEQANGRFAFGKHALGYTTIYKWSCDDNTILCL